MKPDDKPVRFLPGDPQMGLRQARLIDAITERLRTADSGREFTAVEWDLAEQLCRILGVPITKPTTRAEPVLSGRDAFIHNVIAHPLLILCPPLGRWIHQHTNPLK